MTTNGYKSEMSLFPKQSKYQLWNDTVVPIIFINDSGTAVSSACCVRIESGKWGNGVLKCDIKLLELGETPQKETDKFYLYNKGTLIAYGKGHSQKFCVKAKPNRQRTACRASKIWDFLIIELLPQGETVCAPQA